MIAELGLSSQLATYITLCKSLCFNDSMFCVSDKSSGDYQSQCLNETFTLTDLLCVLLIFYTIIIFILSLLYNGKAGEGGEYSSLISLKFAYKCYLIFHVSVEFLPSDNVESTYTCYQLLHKYNNHYLSLFYL